MLKVPVTLFMLLAGFSCFAQKTTFTDAEKASLDSMFREDAFLNMLKTAYAPKSYFVISAGTRNSYFSMKNKQINASQLESKLIGTGSAAYFHKKGFALSVNAFLAAFNGKTNFYQFSLSPSYALPKSKKVAASVSYTRMFTMDGYAQMASPIQNDLYGTAYLKKPWLQPGLSFGISGGRYTDYIKYDTVIFGIRRIFTDTVQTKLQAFSMNVFIQHEFEYYKLFNKKDGVSVLPQFILNAGSQRFAVVHKNPFFNRLRERNYERFKNTGIQKDKTSFSIQSLACNVDINYVIGKFGFEPQVYMDYYLPETADQKFTVLYSFQISYVF